MTTKEYVLAAYHMLLARDPEAGALEKWVKQAEDESWHPAKIAKMFIDSKEFYEKTHAFRMIQFAGLKLFAGVEEVHNIVNHEPFITHHIANQLKPGDVFVDVGAAYGQHGLFAARLVGDRGKAILIDPRPRACISVQRAIKENKLSNCVLYPVAAWNQQQNLFLYTHGVCSYVLEKDSECDAVVLGLLIDDLLKSESRVTCLKFDVEGSEVLAIEGAMATIKKHLPKIYLEVHSKYIQERTGRTAIAMLQSLQSIGYRFDIISLDNDHYIPPMTKQSHTEATDVIAEIPKEFNSFNLFCHT